MQVIIISLFLLYLPEYKYYNNSIIRYLRIILSQK